MACSSIRLWMALACATSDSPWSSTPTTVPAGGGERQTFSNLEADQYLLIEEGKAAPITAAPSTGPSGFSW